jgi:hypothetical protein
VIAAERTGRGCYGIELDPLYVDTIIRRWQAYTGEHARHAASDRTFVELEYGVGQGGLAQARVPSGALACCAAIPLKKGTLEIQLGIIVERMLRPPKSY